MQCVKNVVDMTASQILDNIKKCAGELLTKVDSNEKIGKDTSCLEEQLELLVMMYDSVQFDADITTDELEKVKNAIKSCDCTPDFSDC